LFSPKRQSPAENGRLFSSQGKLHDLLPVSSRHATKRKLSGTSPNFFGIIASSKLTKLGVSLLTE
jgi:hypothetical protein